MYNPYQGRYSQYGPGTGAPGMVPPGMAAPGTGAPPGMQQQDAHQQGRPGSFPPNFQPPVNMPNINFAAPVIRLGAAPSKPDGPNARDDRDRGGRRAGLGSGMGGDYRADRERPQPIQPQSKEEIIKTLFVGGITEGVGGEEGIERILRAGGNLRRWFRAKDADEKPCKFGFAEYEDAESLAIAIEVLKDVQIPTKLPSADRDTSEPMEVEKSTLLVVADENSETYIEQYYELQGGVDMNQKQMLLDQAREALTAVLADLENPGSISKDELSGIDREGDTSMLDGQKTEGDVVTIQLSVDDELSDIPAEMRETVAKEIAAFRDRSNRRDLERLKREEEIEREEKSRMINGNRGGRPGSPPASAPSGPGATNGIPSGPRGAAPAGPKGQGSGFPRDYQKGVTFVNGTGISAATAFEEEDTDASDSDLERRRKGKKDAETEKQFLDQERRWLNRERSRTAAVEREKTRDNEESSRINEGKEAMAKRLHEWDDDIEAGSKTEEYYADRSMWIRNRAAFRQREQNLDDADRAMEDREKAREQNQRERAGAMADDFLARQGDLLEQVKHEDDRPTTPTDSARREPARFKLSLGAAAQRQAQASQAAQASAKRPVTDVEGLLEDEEDVSGAGGRRQLIPIPASQLEKSALPQHMTDEERAAAAQSLAAEIPNEKDALWKWDVQWEYLSPSQNDIIEERLKPFVEKKIVEYLGVQEQMLVDVVVTALKEQKKPEDLVQQLEGALEEEEAEVLVRKLWRMVVFFSESEKRGLGT